MRYACLWAALAVVSLGGCRRPVPPVAVAPPVSSPPAASARPAPPANLVSDADVGEFPEPAWLLTVADTLKLTAAQAAAVKKAKAAFEAETAKDREELAKQSEEFMAFLKAGGDKVDPAEAARRNDEAKAASQRVMARRKAHWAPLWDRLTPDQQALVRDLRARDPFQLR